MVLYDIIKQGYLLLLTTKKGTFQRKKWCKYWFLFIEDTTQLALIYFKSEEQYIAREKNVGFIRFDDCLSFSVIGQQGSTFKNAMVVNTPKQRYIIAAESRYELHEWVYQLHNSLDEFKKREHGVYAIVSNGPGSSPLDAMGDEKQQESSQHQDQQPQGIYAVVRKSNVKPTRQAPPVPPRSKEMNILTDETPPDSVFDSNGDRSRELLVSLGSGSDVDYLAQFRKHKRSLSDSLVITKVIDVGPIAVGADKNKTTSTLKKATSATNLSDEKAVAENKGFELPANVVKRGKRFNKRRKTIAHGGRRPRSQSPPSEPPPPPPSGEKPEKPEVNQAIIDALYALDEELGQNVAVSPNDTVAAVAPIQLEHKTVFATFQSPPDTAHDPTSPTTGHILDTANSNHPQNEVAWHEVSNSDVQQQNRDDKGSDEVDISHCIKPSAAAGKAKIGEVKGDTKGDVTQEEASKIKKVPPPVKPKPPRPSPPLRTTSYNRTIELSSNKATPLSPSSLKPPTSIGDVKQNKESTEQQKKRSPPRVTFPEELEKAINRKSLTTFSLDDLNKEAIERGGTKGSPLSPNKPKNSSGTGAFPMRDMPTTGAPITTTGTSLMTGAPITTGTSITTGAPMMTTGAPMMTTGASMTTTGVSMMTGASMTTGASIMTSASNRNSSTEESMTKIFQNWPNHGLSNGSVTDPMSPVHSEPSQWRDSMADQHIYDDPWDRKMKAINMAKTQVNMKAGDRNSLERRRTFSNGNHILNGGRMGLMDRSYSVEQRSSIIKVPRRGASIEDLYNRGASTVFTDNFKKKGASTENLNSLDPSSPLYVYKKALQNHQQQQQEEEEKERSYTLPLKGSARRRSQQGLIPQQLAQTSLHPRINNVPGNAPSARMFTPAQNGNRKFGSIPVQQQQPQQPMQQQPMQQQPKNAMQYQHRTDSQPLQAQPPRRTTATANYMKTTNPNYRPYALNTRPIPTPEQNGINMHRRPMNTTFPQPVGMGAEDWRYYQSGTRISYDKNSDTTILRSLV